MFGSSVEPNQCATVRVVDRGLAPPMVVVCATATVTCFLVGFRSDYLFAVSVTAWAVAGVVSLAAITGGVALLGRLAQLDAGATDDEDDDEKGEAVRR